MQCPYCEAELRYVDYYYSGRPESFYGTAGNGIHYPSTMQKLGDIYQCPNHEGFDDLDEAQTYKETIDSDLDVEDIVCDSNGRNGFFYTSNGNLQEGYPC